MFKDVKHPKRQKAITAGTEPQAVDMRSFLQSELLRRCDKNPSYSLRAFAKSLNIYHATLSALLSGKRPFSDKTIKHICEVLNLAPQQLNEFLSLNQINGSSVLEQTEDYKTLTIDLFAATSEWYYDAILELTHLKCFKPDPKWIAKVLGISVSEVKIAIERLQNLEFLMIQEDGRWLDVSRNTTTILHDEFTTPALRKYQKKILELSKDSIDLVPNESRDHTSVTVAIQLKDLKEVKERIKKFRRSLVSFLERDGVSPDSVYQISVSFFPLMKDK